jgi:hypothetical protein
MTGGPGMIVREGSGGRELTAYKRECTEARLTTSANTDGGYGGQEVWGVPGGGWEASDRTMPVDSDPLYERNHNTSLIASDRVYRICRCEQTGEWIFREAFVGEPPCDVNRRFIITCGSTPLSGTITVSIAGGSVVGTATGSDVTIGVDGGDAHTVTFTKSGYCTRTLNLPASGCATGGTWYINTWPTSYQLTFRAAVTAVGYGDIFDCPVAGVSIAITGDGTGSGTTDSSGLATITISADCTKPTSFQDITVTSTPPGGIGAAVEVHDITGINPCAPPTGLQHVGLLPATGYVSAVFGGRYMPDTIYWTDDYGSATLTVNVVTSGDVISYGGSYVYNTSNGVKIIDCLIPNRLFPTEGICNHSFDVPVDVSIGTVNTVANGGCSGTSLWTVYRSYYGAGGVDKCYNTMQIYPESGCCGPVEDLTADGDPSRIQWVNMYFPDALTMSAAPGSITGSASVGPWDCVYDSWEDTATDVSVTGT